MGECMWYSVLLKLRAVAVIYAKEARSNKGSRVTQRHCLREESFIDRTPPDKQYNEEQSRRDTRNKVVQLSQAIRNNSSLVFDLHSAS